jgi:predicted kinase
MSAQTLFVFRGLPGSGKTTLARQLDLDVFEADQFFMEGGIYRFDPSKLPQAHAECQRQTLECLEAGKSCVVSNTFTQRWEMQPYIEMAEQTDTRLSVISLFDGGCTDEQLAERNTHGVPLQAIQAMRNRWEHDWKNGSPERLQPPAEVEPFDASFTLADVSPERKKQHVIDVRVVCNSEPVPGWGHDPQDMVDAAARAASEVLGSYDPIVIGSEVKDLKVDELTDSETAAILRHITKEEGS